MIKDLRLLAIHAEGLPDGGHLPLGVEVKAFVDLCAASLELRLAQQQIKWRYFGSIHVQSEWTWKLIVLGPASVDLVGQLDITILG